MKQSWLVSVPVGVALLVSITFSPLIGARPAQALPPDQVARGEAVFNAACLECHGPESTNLDAPLLARPNSLRRFPDAAAAYGFISTEMPGETPGSLTPEEYWDVLAFLLAQSDISTGDVPLGPDNAVGLPTRAAGSTRGPGTGAPSASPSPEDLVEEAPAEDLPAEEAPAEDPPAEPEGEPVPAP